MFVPATDLELYFLEDKCVYGDVWNSSNSGRFNDKAPSAGKFFFSQSRFGKSKTCRNMATQHNDLSSQDDEYCTVYMSLICGLISSLCVAYFYPTMNWYLSLTIAKQGVLLYPRCSRRWRSRWRLDTDFNSTIFRWSEAGSEQCRTLEIFSFPYISLSQSNLYTSTKMDLTVNIKKVYLGRLDWF